MPSSCCYALLCRWKMLLDMPASEPNAPPRFHKTYSIRSQGSLQPRDCCCDACHGHMDFIWISYGFHGIWWSLVELITKDMQFGVSAGGFSQAIRGWNHWMEQGLISTSWWVAESYGGWDHRTRGNLHLLWPEDGALTSCPAATCRHVLHLRCLKSISI